MWCFGHLGHPKEKLGLTVPEYMKNIYKINRDLFDIAEKVSKYQMSGNKGVESRQNFYWVTMHPWSKWLKAVVNSLTLEREFVEILYPGICVYMCVCIVTTVLT